MLQGIFKYVSKQQEDRLSVQSIIIMRLSLRLVIVPWYFAFYKQDHASSTLYFYVHL